MTCVSTETKKIIIIKDFVFVTFASLAELRE